MMEITMSVCPGDGGNNGKQTSGESLLQETKGGT